MWPPRAASRSTSGRRCHAKAAPGVETRILDVSTELSTFGPAAFDVVLASNILEHFEPSTAMSIVEDLARVLRPGGRLIVIQPNFRYAARRYFDDYTHRSVFTDVSLPDPLRAHGFAIEHVQPRFLPYSMRGTRLPIRAWMVRAYLRSPVKPGAGQMLVIMAEPDGTFVGRDVMKLLAYADDFDMALLWETYTRAALHAWHDRPDRPPVVALNWNPATGRMSRISDRDDPQLRTVMTLLMETGSRESLDSVIRGVVNDYVAVR